MGEFDGIIIVSDIDGTLLGKNRRIVPENVEAIEYFKREGGLFTFATGRELMNFLTAIPHPEEICNAPVVLCNGACILDPLTGEVVHEEFLPEPEITRIADAARAQCPDIPFRISVRDGYLGEFFREKTRKTFGRMLHLFHEVPYEQIEHGNWYKLGWDGEPEELKRVAEVLTSAAGDGCLVQLAEDTILEVQSVKGTKGAALSYLKQHLNQENGTLYAIGDYENDYIMLSMADRRAIPKNGIDLLRTLPDVIEVCDHDEGAIAGLIEYIKADIDCRGGNNV